MEQVTEGRRMAHARGADSPGAVASADEDRLAFGQA